MALEDLSKPQSTSALPYQIAEEGSQTVSFELTDGTRYAFSYARFQHVVYSASAALMQISFDTGLVHIEGSNLHGIFDSLCTQKLQKVVIPDRDNQLSDDDCTVVVIKVQVER